MRKIIIICTLLTFAFTGFPQQVKRPKLVVGIVIDQMRWDYLYRFSDRYGKDGFNRLITDGFSCENTFTPYTPTHTAAGHACIYTGSVPALNGIMGNFWYDRKQKKLVYCTDDSTVTAVGANSAGGKMSPRYLWASTITDELRLATNFTSKTIAIAIKDRGSILPGGFSSNGSFWFDNVSGGWITSSFYMKSLPEWMVKFNQRKLVDNYLKQNWNTLYPVSTYQQSAPDSNIFEGKFPGGGTGFPHLTNGGANKYETFKYTPYGNTYTFQTAMAAIDGEQLGKRNVTDFLALSFSSPDYIGHTFGPNSIEVEDNYLRLDKELGEFLKYLDAKIGKGEYLIFLTADHGVAHNPLFMKEHNLASGTFEEGATRRQLNEELSARFNTRGIIEYVTNYQYFLNDSVIMQNNLDKKQVKDFIIAYLLKQDGVARVADLSESGLSLFPEKIRTMLINGYNQKLSGDLQVLFKPQWYENWRTGASHGLWNPYDAHIPLLWYGWNIKPGRLVRETYMTDIAPTLAALLHIQMPNACIGHAITEVVK